MGSGRKMELEKAGIKAKLDPGEACTKYRIVEFESTTTANENRVRKPYERITRRVNCNGHSLD